MSVRVTNTGPRRGKHSVLLFATDVVRRVSPEVCHTYPCTPSKRAPGMPCFRWLDPGDAPVQATLSCLCSSSGVPVILAVQAAQGLREGDAGAQGLHYGHLPTQAARRPRIVSHKTTTRLLSISKLS